MHRWSCPPTKPSPKQAKPPGTHGSPHRETAPPHPEAGPESVASRPAANSPSPKRGCPRANPPSVAPRKSRPRPPPTGGTPAVSPSRSNPMGPNLTQAINQWQESDPPRRFGKPCATVSRFTPMRLLNSPLRFHAFLDTHRGFQWLGQLVMRSTAKKGATPFSLDAQPGKQGCCAFG